MQRAVGVIAALGAIGQLFLAKPAPRVRLAALDELVAAMAHRVSATLEEEHGRPHAGRSHRHRLAVAVAVAVAIDLALGGILIARADAIAVVVVLDKAHSRLGHRHGAPAHYPSASYGLLPGRGSVSWW